MTIKLKEGSFSSLMFRRVLCIFSEMFCLLFLSDYWEANSIRLGPFVGPKKVHWWHPLAAKPLFLVMFSAVVIGSGVAKFAIRLGRGVKTPLAQNSKKSLWGSLRRALADTPKRVKNESPGDSVSQKSPAFHSGNSSRDSFFDFLSQGFGLLC